jgi:hypothetical protein
MKSNLNKIILNFTLILFLSSCHTFEHQNIFLDAKKKDVRQNKEIDNLKEKNTKNKIIDIDKSKSSNEIQMAPINVPKQKQRVKTVALSKKINIPKTKIFELDVIKNWSEKKLIQKMGQSDFIKEEGKLKSYQYYFSSCFLDIFFLKRQNSYYVKHIQTRSTKLYGKIKPEKCLKEISNKINKYP